VTPCRICNSKSSLKLFVKDNLYIVRCKACGLEYTDVSPDAGSLKKLYGETYFRSGGRGTSYFDYLSEGPAMALNAKRRLAGIERFKKPDADSRLLDVGCATGFFLKAASPRWNASGVELSEFASSYARDTAGLSVKTGTLKEASYPDRSFDVVTMWDVIEHLPSPLEDLAEARRIMKDEGLLVLTTGDAASFFARMCGRFWHLYNPAQHLSYFSNDTIGLLLNKAGFKVLRIERGGSLFTLAYLTSGIAMYYPFFISRALHKIVDNMPLKKLKFYVNLGDIMTLYAAKTSHPTNPSSR